MYSSVALVRELSGLRDSTKISNARIVGKITVADSMIDGALAYRYTLPLVYHRKNTIVFSGTATAGSSIAIVINGNTYTITFLINNTASEVADLFRESVASSTEIVTDCIGSGESVLLISKSIDPTTANAQVNVTSAADGSGIVTTIGTRADRYPPSIEYLSADIATAFLLQEEYGVEAQGTPSDGLVRMANLMEELRRLQGKKEPTMRVFDEVTRLELPLDEKDDISYLPTLSDTETDPKISINMVF